MEARSLFSNLPLSEQLDSLFGAGSCELLSHDQPGDLHIAASRLLDRGLTVIGFDYSKQHGSMGTREVDQIQRALRKAAQDDSSVVFLMNTSGVRVTEGTLGVASLRRLLRDALDARLSGVRMLAIVGKSCFGGASILASLCERRLVNEHCLFAMSGPKLIEQVSGSDDLQFNDAAAVRQLLGGASRARVSDAFILCRDDAESYRAALFDWLSQRTAPRSGSDLIAGSAERLSTRLQSSFPSGVISDGPVPIDAKTSAVLASYFSAGYQIDGADGLLFARAHDATRAVACALVGGRAAGARQALRLSEELARLAVAQKRTLILLDSESHSASTLDERLILSEYLAHLALQIRLLHRRGHEIQVIVTGVSGGGIFAALASGASTVCMTPQSRLQVLPQAAMAAINKIGDSEAGGPDAAVAVHAVDSIYTQAA